MADSKTVIMSLSLPPEMRDAVKTAAQKEECSTSELLRDLISEYFQSKVPSEEVDTLEKVEQELSARSEEKSLELPSEIIESVNSAAFKMGCTPSEIISRLASKYITLVTGGDEKEIPIVLKVPREIRGDEKSLRKWLGVKVEGIVSVLK